MSSRHAIVSVASILSGLLVSAASAQQALTVNPPAAAQPPLFQGIMVDAKGKTVGRIIDWSSAIVVRQISGVWVALMALVDGFQATSPTGIAYLFQSADCTGPRYFQVTNLPVQSAIATVPPATQPSVFFPGTPVLLRIASQMQGTTCDPIPTAPTVYVGPVQNVTVSSLGLTPPFSVK
jgi:hypothetical protein